jgi:hypothetical protein
MRLLDSADGKFRLEDSILTGGKCVDGRVKGEKSGLRHNSR